VAKAEPAKKLPQTASPLPLIGLLGTLMMVAGFGLRIVRPYAR
jgi:membrane anchored protein